MHLVFAHQPLRLCLLLCGSRRRKPRPIVEQGCPAVSPSGIPPVPHCRAAQHPAASCSGIGAGRTAAEKRPGPCFWSITQIHGHEGPGCSAGYERHQSRRLPRLHDNSSMLLPSMPKPLYYRELPFQTLSPPLHPYQLLGVLHVYDHSITAAINSAFPITYAMCTMAALSPLKPSQATLTSWFPACAAIANRVLASFEGSTKKRIRLGRRIFQSSGELFEIFSLLLAKTSPGEAVQQEEADMLVDLVTIAHRYCGSH